MDEDYYRNGGCQPDKAYFYSTGHEPDKGIAYDPITGKFIKIAARPPFQNYVLKALNGAGKGTPRCHYFSFDFMQQMLLVALNKSARVAPVEIRYLGRFFGKMLGKFFLYRIAPTSVYGLYCHNLEDAADAFEKVYNTAAAPNDKLKKANDLLFQMNSSLYNLRLPAAPRYNWNSSVQENYDPGEWCYVENNVVKSDNTSLQVNVPAARYARWNGMPPAPAGQNGFYLLNGIDFFITERLMAGARVLYAAIDVTIVKGEVRSGERYLYSSSNAFPRPIDKGCAEAIYCYSVTLGTWIFF